MIRCYDILYAFIERKLERYYETGVDVDAGLRVVPSSRMSTINGVEGRGIRAAVAGILGVEDVINLAKQTHLGDSLSFACGWESVLQIEVGRSEGL